MIVEQAFIALPELLLGNYYAIQEYEAGIVGSLSMAILQELNGRNVSHPIQHLQAERRYDSALTSTNHHFKYTRIASRGRMNRELTRTSGRP